MGTGPLTGITVIELGGIGPGPFAGMLLADLGADVVRVDRPGGSGLFPGDPQVDLLNRGKRSIILDLKNSTAIAAVLGMVERADVLIEGFRPGVAERLGVGPHDCWRHNPALVYGRMTGWGQDGPLSQTAGHDINYIALTGALHAIGSEGGPPQVPVNLLGDFGGGGTYLVIGVLAALRESARSGHGQVIDAAIADGAAHLLASTHALLATATWRDERGVNLLDGGAPFYAIYATADSQYLAVGALEPQFYQALIAGLGVNLDPHDQHDRATWPQMRALFKAAFASQTAAHWMEVFDGTDACVTPILSLRAAPRHPHIAERASIIERAGVIQPGAAPRFSRTPAHPGSRPPRPGEHTLAVLHDFGVDEAESLVDCGAAVQA
jgi:alpha-methylacyl-CoA racemase